MADMGPDLAQKSGGILELARKSEHNSERDCHRLMVKRFKLAMPIQYDFLETGADGPRVPFIPFRNWLKFLLEHNCEHLLCGLVKPDHKRQCDIWKAFWAHYQHQNGDHPIFERARKGEVALQRCIPVLAHGDEGRSKKRSAFLVLNLHSPLGRGVAGVQRQGKYRRYLKMLPNFLGHSYTNRFLTAAVPKSDYTGKHDYVFDLLLEALANEMVHLQNDGVTDRFGNTWWAIGLGVVGDWPWLSKAGALRRSFANVPKHKVGPLSRECTGVCHLCLAGRPNWPYEEVGTRNPIWKQSVGQVSPFSHQIPFERVPWIPNQLETFFHYDLFHTWHLGVAKHYLGSMLALLQARESATTIDERFRQMSVKYIQWCKLNRRAPHCRRITKEHLNWPSTGHFPQGGWHKGDLSTSLMLWVDARARSEDWSGDRMLEAGGEAAIAINAFIQSLYHGTCWLEPLEAQRAAEHGFRFMRRYMECALMARRQHRALWIVLPKIHCLHHILVSLLDGSKTGAATLSPLTTSVQQDEDFIGRNSRLSRHVSAVNTSERVVQRYLQSCYCKFVASGYLVRAEKT